MTREPIEQFIEQMGIFLQEDGLPRIAGQILGFLLIDGEARTLAEITEALGISKASASTNCRLLADKGAVERVGAIGARQDSYVITDDPSRRTLASMADRFRRRAITMDQIAQDFPQNRAGAQTRVLNLSAFFRNSAAFLDEWTAHAQKNDPAETE